MSEMSRQGLWVMVLAGGVGSRFWPLSTPERPKQLLSLGSERPLICDTVERAALLAPKERIRLLAGESLGAALLPAVPGLDGSNLWAEPAARGTGPVLVWAAFRAHQRDPGAVMVSLHADHVISPPERFAEDVRAAVRLANEYRRLFTIGVPPNRPETGYGYIRTGDTLEGGEGFRVAEFVEKPDRKRAERYLAAGGYWWNTGIFVWRVADLLEEVRVHTPEIAPQLELLEKGRDDAFFERVTPVSIDEGVLERSGRVGVVRANFRWDDAGAWDSLFRTSTPDEDGNVVVGAAHAVDTTGSVLFAEDGPVVTFGVDDLIVVRAAGITLVTRPERAPGLKELLARLPERLRAPNPPGQP
ncbi:MAG: mannose-1-phosphate guanylyltransferase [Longimicrobiaceae bacterium]